MSIWKELYDIFNHERNLWQKRGADKQALVFEIKSNLTFLADALQSQLQQENIISNLDTAVFEKAIAEGFALNAINKNTLSINTIANFNEFKKYLDKDTESLIKNAYLKIASLKKLIKANKNKDYSLKIKSLFRFLVLLLAHLENRPLKKRIIKN